VTPLEGGILLLGIFGIPLLLLGFGQRFRHRGRRARGAFWGGVVGYGAALVLWSLSLLATPVLWDEASARIAGVILPLLAVGGLGMALGAAIGREPRRRRKRRGAVKRTTDAASLSLLFLAGSVGGAAAQPPEEIFTLRELDSEVLLAETVPGVPPSAFASSVAVLGTRGVLIVDTFHGPTAANWFMDRIAERTEVPVRWVVNTHHHGDHIWGNAAVLERFPEARILAHPNAMARVTAEGSGAIDAERTRLDGRIERLEGALTEMSGDDSRRPGALAQLERMRAQRAEVERIVLAPPTAPVNDFMRIDVGSRTVWVQPLGPAHTDGDVVVWIDGILVAGDVVEEGLLWLEGADVETWAANLDALAQRGPALVIPAHGGMPESIDRAALLHLHRDALMRAYIVASMLRDGGAPDLSSFADLRERYAEWGVDAEAFDAWIASAISAARRPGGTR